MKRFLLLIVLTCGLQFLSAQISYGITGGLNIATGILPDLKLNTNINSILNGNEVVAGQPQLADFVMLYKAGIFMRLDKRIVSLKFGVNYDKTNIKKEVDASIFRVNVLNIDLSYLDFDFTANLNLTQHFYISAGYVPSLLLHHEGNLNIQNFDQRLLAGFGFKFDNGASLDFDTLVGLSEVIKNSYIHNIMIPVTLSIPLN